jgi:hypothetical protein
VNFTDLANGEAPIYNSTTGVFENQSVGGSLGVSVITETKPSGTHSSVAFTANTTSTQKRQLNTVVNSNLAITLTGTPDWNFTIPTAGTYLFKGRAFIRANSVDSQYITSKLVLNNQSLGLTSVIVGDSAYIGLIHSSTSVENFLVNLDGIYTITGTTVFSLDQITYTQSIAAGGGLANSLGGYTETFASLVITKIA